MHTLHNAHTAQGTHCTRHTLDSASGHCLLLTAYSILYSYYDETNIASKIQPEMKRNPEGKGQGISLGLRLYFTVYPDLSHNTDILNYNLSIVLPGRAVLEELILRIALAAWAIFSSILPVLPGVYWKIYPQFY